jgi:hypothetical protein
VSVVKQVDKIEGLFKTTVKSVSFGAVLQHYRFPAPFTSFSPSSLSTACPLGPPRQELLLCCCFCVFFDLFDFQSVDVERGLLIKMKCVGLGWSIGAWWRLSPLADTTCASPLCPSLWARCRVHAHREDCTWACIAGPFCPSILVLFFILCRKGV